MNKSSFNTSKPVQENFDHTKMLRLRKIWNQCIVLFLIIPLVPVVTVGQNNPEKNNNQHISTLKSGTTTAYHFREGDLIRQSGISTIYVIEKGMLRGIPDLKTFNAKGYSWRAIKEISANEMRLIPVGKPIPSTNFPSAHRYNDGELVRQIGTPAVYVIDKGVRHIIPNLKTFNAKGYSWGAIKEISANEMRLITEGPQIPSVK